MSGQLQAAAGDGLLRIAVLLLVMMACVAYDRDFIPVPVDILPVAPREGAAHAYVADRLRK